jgi:hypothetical protein
MVRAKDGARVLYQGRAPEVVETEVRKTGASIVLVVFGDRLARNDPQGVTLLHQYGDRLDPRDRRTLGAVAETLSNRVAAAAWLSERRAAVRAPAPTAMRRSTR